MTNTRLKKLQPSLQAPEALIGTGVAGGMGPLIETALGPWLSGPSLSQRAATLAAAEADKRPPFCCQQTVYVSFFFDGTGNNLRLDERTLEHSNVARLFRAHPLDDTATGIFRRYIPGIGTPFPEIGDPGKGPIPMVDTHNGMGAVGQKRLDWAFEQLDDIVKAAEARAQNPTNKIVSIKVAVFGFSRGATLARAFVRDLLDPRKGRTVTTGNQAMWKGRYLFSVEFMGLWDTVAAVGLPMSANNADNYRSARRWKSNVGRAVIVGGTALYLTSLSARSLAFGAPGADPSPGVADGHGAWAEGLAIPPQVKQCVHMIAAHEVRNSFPVDSVQRGSGFRASNCKEMMYPGMHSDVGGGYRPGEQGKSVANPAGAVGIEAAALVLARIPLHGMYDEAVAAGVPLRKRSSPSDWKRENIDDFVISPTLIDRYNHYMDAAGRGGRPLGAMMLAHMRYFYAWRWKCIFRGRDESIVMANQRVFGEDRAALQRKKEALMARKRSLLRHRGAGEAEKLTGLNAEIKELQDRLDLGADDSEFLDALHEFDREMIDDVRSIIAVIDSGEHQESELRPHYRNLVETYRDEQAGRGLQDEKIIAFFDDHVHDSLAGFNQDSTLPSDPRVVYVGSDVKLDYARNDTARREERVPA